MSDTYKPPFTINNEIVNRVSQISELIGTFSENKSMNANPRLRRDNRVKTIHASLAIENNSLSLEQVTDIINGKRVLGPASDILEVRNAYEVYDKLPTFSSYSINDMLMAHKILMDGLTEEAGQFRSSGVGVFNGERLIHMAPPAELVPEHIGNLINWVKETDVHPLIKSSVFHYELEFIHPFTDGNGRMGRLWQSVILCHWKPLFAWLPVESIIRNNQEKYYKVLAESDRLSDSTGFIVFMLDSFYEALSEFENAPQDNIVRILKALGDNEMSANEIMERMKLKNRASFRKRYLLPALENGKIEMTIPDKPNSSKQRYRKKQR